PKGAVRPSRREAASRIFLFCRSTAGRKRAVLMAMSRTRVTRPRRKEKMGDLVTVARSQPSSLLRWPQHACFIRR
ncbi:unnamed protein product, partial [Symbiodinium sp. CCMP2592]